MEEKRMETGLKRELENRRNKRFSKKELANFFGITSDGLLKKVNYNRFSVEEAIALLTTYYKKEEITLSLLIYLFTYSIE